VVGNCPGSRVEATPFGTDSLNLVVIMLISSLYDFGISGAGSFPRTVAASSVTGRLVLLAGLLLLAGAGRGYSTGPATITTAPYGEQVSGIARVPQPTPPRRREYLGESFGIATHLGGNRWNA